MTHEHTRLHAEAAKQCQFIYQAVKDLREVHAVWYDIGLSVIELENEIWIFAPLTLMTRQSVKCICINVLHVSWKEEPESRLSLGLILVSSVNGINAQGYSLSLIRHWQTTCSEQWRIQLFSSQSIFHCQYQTTSCHWHPKELGMESLLLFSMTTHKSM